MTLPNIFTIGYEGASVEDLIATLKAAGVSHLIDIRESPYSRRHEFSREELAGALAEYGLAYTHIGELGNPPAGREAARAGHMAVYREIFTAHLNGPDGRKGLERVLSLAAAEPVCMMCFEKSASHCHRSMVAARLEPMSGVSVEHLRVHARQAHPAQGAFEF